MLKITVPGNEYWDPYKEEFITLPSTDLTLEHSLLSVSKWEEKWHRSFLNDGPKTEEEFLDYIRCMILEEDYDSKVLRGLSIANVQKIKEYLMDSHTATWFGKTNSYLDGEAKTKKPPKARDVITSELIYYWLVALQIPFECERWNLNRLLTLVRVCNEKNTPPKKMSKKQLLSRNAALNEARRQQLNSRG
jgi:hypothetical protein